MEKEDLVLVRVIFYGRVQGVFFRDSTKRLALQENIRGTVRNVPDGTVELFALGKRSSIEKVIEKLQSPDGPGNVSRSCVEFLSPAIKYEGFRILY